MSFFQIFTSIFAALLLIFPADIASLSQNYPKKLINFPIIVVDKSGGGNFTTIQAAIDSVPSYNTRWICIYIKQGVYREKVTIPFDKPFIYLKGAGSRSTFMVWDGHDSIATGATFTSQADNIIANGLTFMNSYNYPINGSGNPMMPAVAALIEGDRSAFYRCVFMGLQDTLWDVQGRHYFKHCTIQGAVDFIFGSGQSLYEGCTIAVVAGALNGSAGYITAQGRSEANETNGFVFKNCNIVGNGKTFLGRPWRDYARVVFYNTTMSDIIVPQGWDPWFSVGHEYDLSFDEIDCHGLGSDTSERVSWANKMRNTELQQLTSISFIDDGWLSNFYNILAI
ncbi:Pectinesterase [Handroanthus impetiginosus]|uniref:Pectinesterase n=1 Tax=Handroanthus impetiginosus TaxID=429701 RepID=A0A2G9H206_9LAMI|nr:Pectinesterase [Handroanthus impetiginosus]